MIKREELEEKQIGIYIATLVVSVVTGLSWSNSHLLDKAIEPVIAVLLYSMFCQIPFLELKKAFSNRSFFKALLLGNFVLIPFLVWILISIFPLSQITTIGVLLVLLTPCIDYVIIFTHLGKGDAKSVLASTPLLFIFQLLLLPLYLWLFLGKETISIIEIKPFAQAFVYLIVLPFILSVITQLFSKRSNQTGKALLNFSSWLPVPLMALTFFVVIASQIGVVYKNAAIIYTVLPVYILFAILAPLAGKLSARLFRVGIKESRAISFSTATRNSLVVLPLALSLPVPVNQLAAIVIVTQTIVEIFFELLYIKVIPVLTKEK
jgi:ACR3 family arsenite transporter